MTGDHQSSFHGAATINDKGQVVIPAPARKAMDLSAGDKLLVFSFGEESLMLCKVSQIEKYAAFFSKKLEDMRAAAEAAADAADDEPVERTKKKGRPHERRPSRP